MKCYALLIGINAYAQRPLRQCVNDVRRIEEYLRSAGSSFDGMYVVTLTDTEATRVNIIHHIRTHLSQASDRDIALLYFSGHGAQEQTAGIFPDEHDGLLDSLVCYDKDDLSTAQFIANKELRYLFHQFPANPHLITIVDACHSGDIVRAYHENHETDHEMMRRITGAFPARAYQDFLFAGDPSVEQKTVQGVQVFIPYKNSIHIAACLSSESAWEDAQGGVFTRYLISLIEATHGNLTYLDITRWARISLQGITAKKQTPVLSVQGEGTSHANNSWLNLHPGGVDFPAGLVVNSPGGWIYTRGSLLGVKPGMTVLIRIDDDTVIAAQVSETDTVQAKLDIPLSDIGSLDFNRKSYPADTEECTYTSVRLAINAIDNDPATIHSVQKILSGMPHIQLAGYEDADFLINIFNNFIYCSLPEHDFQPLARQTGTHDNALDSVLKEQLRALVKWHHFHALENPGQDFEVCPLRVSLQEDGSDGWNDVTDGTFRMKPQPKRLRDGTQFQKVRIRVENISDERLYVAVLTLNSDLSITSKPFDGKVVELRPGEKKVFYDYQAAGMVYVSMEDYKEIYNWKEEWFYYKIIFNNYEDFTTALNDHDYLQPSLAPPLTIERQTRNLKDERVARGEGGDLEEVQEKWGTCCTRIELSNAEYNCISGDLKSLWEAYASSQELAPFIKELYFEDYYNGKYFEPRLKQNKDQTAEEAQRATDIWYVKMFNKIYNISRRRKFNRQRHRTGPLVVAEGDSWFLFPKPGVRDTLDYLMDHYRLLSLANAGDEVADYIKNNKLLKAVIDQKPDFVLISGGGNDILGAEIREILLPGVRNGRIATDYLKMDVFESKLTFLRDAYVMFFEKIHVLRPGVTILIHGYDYIRHNPDPRTIKNGWANKYMIEAGMKNSDDRQKVIHFLVDTFNDMLSDFARDYAYVKYVDHRGTVGPDEWMDEIHPNNTGYGKVAENFLHIMRAV